MIFKLSLLAIFCFATLVLSVNGLSIENGAAKNAEFHVKALPTKDRLMLFLASKLSPKSFERLPKDLVAEISEYPDSPYVDSFFLDARLLFTQAKKLSENSSLPEFNWSERYDFCVFIYCFNMELSFDTSNSKFVGAENTVSTTKITPTTIENTFNIPYFNWTSPGFLFNITDYDAESIFLSGNGFVSFTNVTTAFSVDYHFVEDVGIQLYNLSIYFDPGQVRGWLLDIAEYDFQGNLIERYEPEEYPYDEQMMEYWSEYKREYTEGLQYSLNCFLSNGRLDPEGCAFENDDIEEGKYYNLINMQFIQSLGLGALV